MYARRAGNLAARTQGLGRCRQPEVGQPRVAAPIDHDVCGLEVAVQHTAVMRGGQAGAYLTGHFDALVGGQPSDASQQRREVFAVDELHRQKVTAVDVAHVVDAAHVRMRNLPRDAHLVEEALQARRLTMHRFGQELERDRLAQLQVLGPIHLPHATATDQSDDAVAAKEKRARREAALIERRGVAALRRS